jgi:VCBS repeat-containing protein
MNKSSMAFATLLGLGLLTLTALPTFAAPNQPPVAKNDSFSTNEDTVLGVLAPGVLANDTDPEQDTLTAILVSPPVHGTLTLNSNGSFTYVPAANFNGTDSFTYKANDGRHDSAVATVSITVRSVNDAPVARNVSFTINEDDILGASRGILFDALDVDGDTLTATIVSAPSHGTLQFFSDGHFGYFPQANFNGADAFIYRVSDGHGATANGTVTIIIRPVDDPPVVGNQALDVGFNNDRTFRLAGTDVEGDALTFRIVTPPSHGTISGTSPVFKYTADTGFIGTDHAMYVANDGHADSAPATLTFHVKPVITIGDIRVSEGGPVAVFGATMEFKVTLTPAVSFPVSVHAESQDGTAVSTATAGLFGDYDKITPPDSDFTFAPGQTHASVFVTIIGDVFFEPDETFTVHLTSNEAIVTRVATGTILNDDINIGVAEGVPPTETVQVGEQIDYGVKWTHPEGWQLLNTIDIRISDPEGPVLTVRFDQTSNTFGLVDPADLKEGRTAAPGSNHRFETSAVTMYLKDSQVIGSGPTGPSVLLNLSLSFKPKAAGRVFSVEALATDDFGNKQGFDPAGTITVLPK